MGCKNGVHSDTLGVSPDQENPVALPHLPYEARHAFQALLARPAPDIAALRARVTDYLEEIRAHFTRNEFIDLPLAEALARTSHALLDHLEAHPLSEDDTHLALAAILYFVEKDDGDHDLASPIGFDDDQAVLDAVIRHLDLAV